MKAAPIRANRATSPNRRTPSQPPLSPVGRTLKTANREEADNYHSIVVRLNAKWRVIVCKDGFRATTIRPEDFEVLVTELGLAPKITIVDGSTVFCEIIVP